MSRYRSNHPASGEYRVYAYSYVEERGVWRCDALDLEAEQLSALKRAIEKADDKTRKLDVPALYVDTGSYYGDASETKIKDVVITKRSTRLRSYVWIRQGRERPEEVRSDNLYEVKHRKALTDWLANAQAAEKAVEAAKVQRSKIPHYDPNPKQKDD